jgi:tetratricopeptide (TPR) repeat protein
MSIENNVVYERAVELYEEAVVELDDAKVERILREAIAMLQAAPTEPSTAADALHLLGLCWYELPQGGEEELQKAKDAFVAALDFDPNHQYANLFLGHALFDMGQYDDALARFRRFDTSYFRARDQEWRVVKNDELILCCRLQTDETGVTLDDVDEVCQRYESDPELPVPREIVLCLDELAAKARFPLSRATEYARRVVAMIERTDNLQVEYLQAEITRLSNLA